MKKISSGLGKRSLALLKLAGSSLRLGRTERERVAENSRRFLAQSMGRLRGLPQKVGQILSMGDSPDAAAYADLTGSAEPLAFEVIEQALAHEWGRPWRQVLAEIEPEGLAASLGQVHRARLLTGEQVAVKVQYPGIAKAVETDLKLLGWLSIPLGGFRRQFNLAGYREELLRDLGEELDYRVEAENQHQYGFLAKYTPSLVVPSVFGALTTGRVLVTAWEEGETLQQVAAGWSEEQRKAAGRIFLEHALGFFQRGFVHADLHPGNFRFRRNPQGQVELLLYDFGCIFRAPMAPRLALLRLIDITEANGSDDPYPLFVKLGFNPDYLEPLAEKLPALCRVLFEPFIATVPFAIQRWALAERVAAVLGEERWNFRVAGPPEMIFLLRMFHGLLHTLGTLGCPQPWGHILQPIRAQFAPEVAALPLEIPQRKERGFGQVANHLKIRVRRDGETKVRLTSPVQAIDSLDEMMDDPLRRQLAEQNIDLDQLVLRVRRSGYRPQEVFKLETPEKEVRVWLE